MRLETPLPWHSEDSSAVWTASPPTGYAPAPPWEATPKYTRFIQSPALALCSGHGWTPPSWADYRSVAGTGLGDA